MIRTWPNAIWALASSMLGVAATALAQMGPEAAVHIATYRSPSGTCEFTVDPQTLHGDGPADCELKRTGDQAWHKTLGFTFAQATAADDGTVAGYAYEHGADDQGDLIIAVLAADGTERLVKHIARKYGNMTDTPPGPMARGCFLDAAGDRFVVRFRADENDFRSNAERWERYRLSDGAELPALTLAAPDDTDDKTWSMAVDARPLYGTDLTVVLWARTQWGPPRQAGARLSLVDPACRVAWTQVWPQEFAAVEDSFSPWELGELGAIQTSEADPGVFVYRSFGEKAAITFAAKPDPAAPGSWTVTETARKPDTVSFRTWDDGPISLDEVNLQPRGTIELTTPGADQAALSADELSFDAASRIGFIDGSTADGQYVFMLVDSSGATVARMPLGVPAEDKRPGPVAAWAGGDKWLAIQGSYSRGPTPRGWTIDVAARTVTPIEGLSCPNPGIQHDMTGSDSGVAVLGGFEDPRVAVIDAAGKTRWTSEPLGLGQGVAMRDGGGVGVLLGVANEVLVFDAAGNLTKTIELEKSMGRKPNYVAGLAPDADGGWILHDFNGAPPIVRLDAEGKVKSGFQPHYPDGRTFTLYGGVRRAPDGHLWTSDRSALLRLDEQGAVDRVLGRGPQAASLGQLRALAVANGLIYAVDGGNGSVHVFDAGGAWQRVLKPEPTDFPVSGGGIGSITVAGDGSVFYRTDTIAGFGAARYLKFGPDGARQGFQDSVGREVSEEWWFRPGTMEKLVLGYERAWLVGADGAVTATIERRADRKWLDKPHAAAVAPDGSFVISARPGNGLFSDVLPSMTVYAPDGTPKRTLDLTWHFQYARVAFNGKTAVASSAGDLVVLDANTGKAGVFHVPGADDKSWLTPFMSPDGGEVWVLDAQAKRLQRYALPAR